MIARRSLLALLAVLSAACAGRTGNPSALADDAEVAADARIEWGLVLHGGAGTIERGSMSPEREGEYRAAMETALRAGHAELARGGNALDAVVAAITIMEDNPLFNAGRGAVFTAEGTNSLDASIMDGATLQAGAIAGVMRVKNPIQLARLVMERSPHVMLSGAGARSEERRVGKEGHAWVS